jgi:hypothetical protein
MAVVSGGALLRKPPAPLTPFVPQAPPQRAFGDFDGDGRVDAALLEGVTGDRRISVKLSGSIAAVRLDATVTGIIEGDIDHDGDLDLVAATSSGDVLVWLNDGHGRFTRQAASPTRGVSGEPVLNRTIWPESMAIGIRAPLLPSPDRRDAIVSVTRIRAPAAGIARDVPGFAFPALRAPPARLA